MMAMVATVASVSFLVIWSFMGQPVAEQTPHCQGSWVQIFSSPNPLVVRMLMGDFDADDKRRITPAMVSIFGGKAYEGHRPIWWAVKLGRLEWTRVLLTTSRTPLIRDELLELNVRFVDSSEAAWLKFAADLDNKELFNSAMLLMTSATDMLAKRRGRQVLSALVRAGLQPMLSYWNDQLPWTCPQWARYHHGRSECSVPSVCMLSLAQVAVRSPAHLTWLDILTSHWGTLALHPVKTYFSYDAETRKCSFSSKPGRYSRKIDRVMLTTGSAKKHVLDNQLWTVANYFIRRGALQEEEAHRLLHLGQMKLFRQYLQEKLKSEHGKDGRKWPLEMSASRLLVDSCVKYRKAVNTEFEAVARVLLPWITNSQLQESLRQCKRASVIHQSLTDEYHKRLAEQDAKAMAAKKKAAREAQEKMKKHEKAMEKKAKEEEEKAKEAKEKAAVAAEEREKKAREEAEKKATEQKGKAAKETKVKKATEEVQKAYEIEQKQLQQKQEELQRKHKKQLEEVRKRDL